MKKYNFILVLVIFLSEIFCTNAQQKTIKMVILDAKQNGSNISEWYLKRNQYLSIYTNKNELGFANVSSTNNEQSYGGIFGLEVEDTAETDSTYKGKDIHFSWKYKNNYDSKEGTAKMNISLVYKPQGTVFYCHMMLENLDLYEYTGYLEGGLDNSKFGK
jgi:hypothetical protein